MNLRKSLTAFVLAFSCGACASAWAGITGGHVLLDHGRLEVELDDATGTSGGLNDILDLYLGEGFTVTDDGLFGNEYVQEISSDDRLGAVQFSGVIYRSTRRDRVKVRLVVPATDTVWTSFTASYPSVTLEGGGAKALFELVRHQGRLTLDDGRILRFEKGAVLCFERVADGSYNCRVDL